MQDVYQILTTAKDLALEEELRINEFVREVFEVFNFYNAHLEEPLRVRTNRDGSLDSFVIEVRRTPDDGVRH